MNDFYILCTGAKDIRGYRDTQGKTLAIEWKNLNQSIVVATITAVEYQQLKQIPDFRRDLKNHVIAVLKKPSDLPKPTPRVKIEKNYEFHNYAQELMGEIKEQISLDTKDFSREKLIELLAKNYQGLRLLNSEFYNLLAHNAVYAETLAKNGLAINPEEAINLANKMKQDQLDAMKIIADSKQTAAFQSAAKRYKNDPKQKIKFEIKQNWMDFKQKNPKAKKAPFIRQILKNYGGDDRRRHLQNEKVIEKWLKEAEKESSC